MRLQECLEAALAGRSLDPAGAEGAMRAVLEGQADPAWLAGWLIALRAKGEHVDELEGFSAAMRSMSTGIDLGLEGVVDTCGTGGDGTDTFNVSTTAAFVAAGAGARVAKHGNRSVSSRCGSADVLEALGGRIDLPGPAVRCCVLETGFGFFFAPVFHGAMRHAAPVRRALGVRTVFNLLGPLANPAGARRQLLGVFDPRWLDPLAEVLARRGVDRALLVHGRDGIDELGLGAVNDAVLVEGARRQRLEIDPGQLGLAPADLPALRGGDASRNAELLRAVLGGEEGPMREVTVLNAGAALWVAGLHPDLPSALDAARSAIDTGAASRTLERWIRRSRELSA